MLTQETLVAISLLKELNLTNCFAVREQSLPASLHPGVGGILERLCHEGLLRTEDEVEKYSGIPPLYRRYVFVRPLYELTLYDVLRARGAPNSLPVNSSTPDDEIRGPITRRLEVLDSTVRYFLSQIRLVEVFVSDVYYDMKNEGLNNG